jgi:hypothetical protein
MDAGYGTCSAKPEREMVRSRDRIPLQPLKPPPGASCRLYSSSNGFYTVLYLMRESYDASRIQIRPPLRLNVPSPTYHRIFRLIRAEKKKRDWTGASLRRRLGVAVDPSAKLCLARRPALGKRKPSGGLQYDAFFHGSPESPLSRAPPPVKSLPLTPPFPDSS